MRTRALRSACKSPPYCEDGKTAAFPLWMYLLTSLNIPTRVTGKEEKEEEEEDEEGRVEKTNSNATASCLLLYL